MQKKNFKAILIALAAVIAISGGIVFYQKQTSSGFRQEDMKSATLLQAPRPIQPFKLQDMHQRLFSQENLKGHWNLVFFGFTHCASICPTALAKLNTLYRKLEAEGIKSLPRVIFITVDPERDQPKVLLNYLAHFNPNFLGLTGKEKQINQVAKELGAVYIKAQGKELGSSDETSKSSCGEPMGKEPCEESDEDSMIDHSTALFVINPKGEFSALFSSPDEIDEIFSDLRKILR